VIAALLDETPSRGCSRCSSRRTSSASTSGATRRARALQAQRATTITLAHGLTARAPRRDRRRACARGSRGATTAQGVGHTHRRARRALSSPHPAAGQIARRTHGGGPRACSPPRRAAARHPRRGGAGFQRLRDLLDSFLEDHGATDSVMVRSVPPAVDARPAARRQVPARRADRARRAPASASPRCCSTSRATPRNGSTAPSPCFAAPVARGGYSPPSRRRGAARPRHASEAEEARIMHALGTLARRTSSSTTRRCSPCRRSARSAVASSRRSALTL
jgi:hypothetical protein